MLKSYLSTAWRNLMRQKGNALVKIFGLSIALSFCLLTFLMMSTEFTFDEFHENAARIYRVDYVADFNGKTAIYADAPMPVGASLKETLPEVEYAARLIRERGICRYQDKVLNETVHFAGQDFLNMFSFQLWRQSGAPLKDRDHIILSEAYAKKYFGEANPLGKTLTIDFPQGSYQFTVKDIAEEIPLNSSIHFDMLVSIDLWRDLNSNMDEKWNHFQGTTFVQLASSAAVGKIEQQMAAYAELTNRAGSGKQIIEYQLEPLSDMRFNVHIRNRDFSTGSETGYYFMMMSVFGLLLIGCFNFINLSIAGATSRMKEIGVRKVLGANRMSLIKQFLTESFLVSLLSMTLGILLAILLLPGFNDFYISDFTAKVFFQPGVLIFAFLLMILTGFLSGAYPALYISALQVVKILKRDQKISGKNRFSKALISTQFTLSIIFITLALIFFAQNRLLTTVDTGYESEHVLVVDLQDQQVFDVFKNEALKQNIVSSVSGSDGVIGWGLPVNRVVFEDREIQADFLSIAPDYLKTLGIQLQAGRSFESAAAGTVSGEVLVNDAFVKEMGWKSAIGKSVLVNGESMAVTGVVKDFFTQDLYSVAKPLVLQSIHPEAIKYISIKVDPAHLATAKSTLANVWKTTAPDVPFEFFYQDDVFANNYINFQRVELLVSLLAGTTILIACFGLFALTTLMLARRMKEIGIRKVLGASSFRLVFLVVKDVFLMITLANVLAWPLAYYFGNLILQSYPRRIDLTLDYFLEGTLLAVAFTLMSIAYHAVKVIQNNPIQSLRYE